MSCLSPLRSLFSKHANSSDRIIQPGGPHLETKLAASDTASQLSERTLAAKAPCKGTEAEILEKVCYVGSDVPEDTTGRLEELRGVMRKEGVDVYIVPSEDAHGSEYTAESDKRRHFISGFNGSAGTAVIFAIPEKPSAHLFVDGRYHIQAEKQLGPEWTLHKVGARGVVNWDAWIATQNAQDMGIGKGTKVGIDARLCDYGLAKRLSASLTARQAKLVAPSINLVDEVWHNKPTESREPVVVHPFKYAGLHASQKLVNLRHFLSHLPDTCPETSAYFVSALDELAWLLNLRGNSIPYNPLFPGYFVLSPSRAILFVRGDLIGEEARSYLNEELGVELREYEEVWDCLREKVWRQADEAKLVVDGRVSWAVVQAAGEASLSWLIHFEENVCVLPSSPITDAKAIKNSTELEGFKAAYLRDGASWVRWAAWLDESVRIKKAEVSEWDAAVELYRIREKHGGKEFRGHSYEPISATGPNAALPHYEPTASESAIISRHTPYVCDCGVQYLDGTIDTTRTMHFGRPSKEQKRAYTRVLQGHIAIDTAIFPEGTAGAQLDVLSRNRLWRDGMNFLHGLGHGVGSYSTVHEGGTGFGSSIPSKPIILKEGHVITNEPGFYLEGHFGIRTESLIAVKQVSTRVDWGDKNWLGFERITQVPVDTALIDWSLLSPEESKWVVEHNAEVKRKVLPLVKDDRRAVRWLARQ